MTPAPSSQPILNPAQLQRSFVGVCIALLLVGGLISVPSTCHCGARVAHGHSLFILPGHHHVPDGSHVHVDHGESHDRQRHTVETATNSGPQLTGKVAHGSDRLAVALTSVLAGSNEWQSFNYPASADELGSGWLDAPDAPPPQHHQLPG